MFKYNRKLSCETTCFSRIFTLAERRLTRIQIGNAMVTLYCAEHVLIVQTRIQIPTAYFCIGQESESKSIPESILAM